MGPSMFYAGNKRPFYRLQMLDRENVYIWDVNIKMTSEPHYVPAKPQYKFITTNVSAQFETNIIELELIPTKSDKSILKRAVLVEKTGCKKSIIDYNDPITTWSLQETSPNDLFKNTRDFILTRMEEMGTVEKTWFLAECSLLDSQVWRSFTEEFSKGKVTIFIKPKSIMLHP
jgi:hypothetical protein